MNSERRSLIKRLSILLIISFNSILIYAFDSILLKYQIYRLNANLPGLLTNLPDKLKKQVPKIEYKNSSSFDYGIYLKEGSMVNEIIFDHRHHHYDEDFIFESNGEKTYWIFGDSWGGGINTNERDNSTITNYLDNESQKKIKSLRIISSGSWSPSLINLALRKKISQFNEIPDYIVFFIDQTDIGDEICRYRPFVFRDSNNRLVGIARNPNDSWGGLKYLNYHFLFGRHRSGIVLAIQRIIIRVARPYLIFPGITDCRYNDIITYQLGKEKSPNGTPVLEYTKYFNSSLSELIIEVKQFNSDAKILLVTHDWAQHNLSKSNKDYFPKHIKDLVSEIAGKNEKVFHFNISLEDYDGLGIKDVFQYPEDLFSHPKDYQIISKKISEYLNMIEPLH